MLKSGELPIEPRIRSLEQVLFKTSQSDRNRLFDHIYEKIKMIENNTKIEVDRLDRKLRRFEKRADTIKVETET